VIYRIAPSFLHAEDALEKPMDGNKIKLAKWAILYPLNLISKYTIPGKSQKSFDANKIAVIQFVALIVCT
jgi:hypothetical protein